MLGAAKQTSLGRVQTEINLAYVNAGYVSADYVEDTE
jgi:hypothetical protein